MINTLLVLLQDVTTESRERTKKGPQAVAKIKQALDFMRNENFEVPFIAFYRKEYVQPELNINDLWKVYKFDEKVSYLKLLRSYSQIDDHLFLVVPTEVSEN